MSIAGPVERKVQASSAAAAASGLLLWVLGRYVFKGTVPDVVASWVYAVIPGVLAFGAGWLAKHTPRPAPPPAVTVSVTPDVSGKQVTDMLSQAVRRGGYSAGSRTVSDLPTPPPSVTTEPPVVPLGTPPQPPGGTP